MCTSMRVHVLTHACGGQKATLGIFLYYFSTSVCETGSLLTNDWQASMFLLFSAGKTGDYMPTCIAFHVDSRDINSSFMSCSMLAQPALYQLSHFPIFISN